MCGICGVYAPDGAANDPAFERAVRRMTSLMARRGPDDEGFWKDPQGRLLLGFRRLAILDPTPAGRQPMVSGDGRSVLVFNGEIYNFAELRGELEAHGCSFRSRTDTEVLLEALNRWGPERTIPRLNGMFGFAWYRPEERFLVLARDHAGIKPLYYHRPSRGRGLVFGSQYDVLLRSPWGVPDRPRGDVLRLFLRLHHIPAPYGLLENTFQLPPGHYLQVRGDGEPSLRCWWRLPPGAPEEGMSGEEAVDAVDEALRESVSRQRIADVPLGVFLSGGIDSPAVAAELRRQSGPGLKAFTISSPGWRQDEAADAAVYAERLGVDHRIHPVSDRDAVSAVADVVAAQYEPFADFSILPTLLVSRFARSEVTVALSGDGGDELFFGYERPGSLLRNGADFRYPAWVRRWLYRAGRAGILPKRSGAVVYADPGAYYLDVNSRLRDADLARIAPGLEGLPEDFDLYAFDRYRGLEDLAAYSREVEFYGQLQRGLKKVDMASMHESLEVRVPLLDRRVVETSLQLDPLESHRRGVRKIVLRRLLERSVPPESIPESKRGFAVPLADWLRSGLRKTVEEVLFDQPLFPEGVFDRRALLDLWTDHGEGRRDAKWAIWTIFCLQCWAREHLLRAVRERDGKDSSRQ